MGCGRLVASLGGPDGRLQGKRRKDLFGVRDAEIAPIE